MLCDHRATASGSARTRPSGPDPAIGRGSVGLLQCTPSCARGLRRTSVATIRLSGLKRCESRRFYGAAEITVGAGADRSFARAFIGAPC